MMLKNQMGRTEQQVWGALDPISSPGSGSSTKPLVLSLLQFLDEGSEPSLGLEFTSHHLSQPRVGVIRGEKGADSSATGRSG